MNQCIVPQKLTSTEINVFLQSKTILEGVIIKKQRTMKKNDIKLPQEGKFVPMKNLDIKAFNKDLALLKQDTDYDEQLRMVDSILLKLENETEEEAVIKFPVEIRPKIEITSIFGRKTKGKIGCIYMEEEEMNMFYPYCDVYSEKCPNKKLLKCQDLLHNKVVISEVLKAIQLVIDPDGKNEKLAQAIEKSETIENRTEEPLYAVLHKYGITSLSLSSSNSCTRYCESDVCGDITDVYLTPDGKVMSILDSGETVQITQTIKCYRWLVDSIKRAVNIAIGRGNNKRQVEK